MRERDKREEEEKKTWWWWNEHFLGRSCFVFGFSYVCSAVVERWFWPELFMSHSSKTPKIQLSRTQAHSVGSHNECIAEIKNRNMFLSLTRFEHMPSFCYFCGCYFFRVCVRCCRCFHHLFTLLFICHWLSFSNARNGCVIIACNFRSKSDTRKCHKKIYDFY